MRLCTSDNCCGLKRAVAGIGAQLVMQEGKGGLVGANIMLSNACVNTGVSELVDHPHTTRNKGTGSGSVATEIDFMVVHSH